MINSLVCAAILFSCTFGGFLLGVFLRKRIPDPHLSSESKDAIKLGTGLIATIAGLVLGLLTASAKSSFDAQRSNLQQMAANIVMLDRALAHFGPEASDAREQLRQTIVSLREHLWPAYAYQPKGMDDPSLLAISKSLSDSIRALPANTESQRTLKGQAIQLSADIGKNRWQLNRWDDGALPIPFLTVLVFWLSVLFMSFGLFSPKNATVMVVMLVCTLSVAGALFLIIELDQPYGGLLRISSAPIDHALEQLGK